MHMNCYQYYLLWTYPGMRACAAAVLKSATGYMDIIKLHHLMYVQDITTSTYVYIIYTSLLSVLSSTLKIVNFQCLSWELMITVTFLSFPKYAGNEYQQTNHGAHDQP